MLVSDRCWRGSACPFAHPHRVWWLRHTVVGPQSKNVRMQQKRQVHKKAPFPPDAQRLGPNAWQPTQHQVRRRKETTGGKFRTWPANAIFETRWSTLAPAIVGILGRTRLPKGPGGETQSVAEDGAWCSGAENGNGNPSARRPRPYPRRGHRCDEFLRPVCEKARGTFRVTLCHAVTQTISGGHSSTSNTQILTAAERNEEEEEEVCGGNADTSSLLMCRGDVWYRRNTATRKKKKEKGSSSKRRRRKKQAEKKEGRRRRRNKSSSRRRQKAAEEEGVKRRQRRRRKKQAEGRWKKEVVVTIQPVHSLLVGAVDILHPAQMVGAIGGVLPIRR